jgi:hypothetical protein
VFGCCVFTQGECVAVGFAAGVAAHAFKDSKLERGVAGSADGLGIETCTLGPVAYRDRAVGSEHGVRERVEGSVQAADPYTGDRVVAPSGAESRSQMSVYGGVKRPLNLPESTR